MELAPGSNLHGFEIIAHNALPEIDGESIEGIHRTSGARLLYLKNDDNNKAFAIGFRTPPHDDTGVFHILEHSVLCGSRRFPVKEPFVDLLKNSMQTFLNAMTFADKTLYPVASTNEHDLFNLMDVYLDAVFHPNIYEKQAIFEQEGWHYELMANDGKTQNPAELPASETTLVYNGVVYNEMKGALSDANSVLYDNIQAALFPGTCYAFESGGTPRDIPTLDYKEFLNEHRRHYRTDNSYIILYGNLDIDHALEFLDTRYLDPVAAEQRVSDAKREKEGLEPLVPRSIEMAGGPGMKLIAMPQLSDRCGGSRNEDPTTFVPVDQAAGAPVPYLCKTMDTAPENACAACGYVIGTSADCLRATAVEILLDALLGSNEAPLKRALLDAGIAHDVQAYVPDALLQPFAVVQLQMPREGAGRMLATTLSQAVSDLLAKGLDHELVEAALSHAEFQMREHDMGIADGVMYAIMALSSWLYDDAAATDYLRYEHLFAELRERLEQGYFEELAKALFCENNHCTAVEIVPTPGESTDDSAERLAALNQALSIEQREHIVAEEALLRQLQEAPDSPEAIATLPHLGIGDIGTAPETPSYQLANNTSVPCIRHNVPTNGIAYSYRYFGLESVSFEDLPYVSILAGVLGKLDTTRHSAAELDTLTQGKLGNLTFFTDVYESADCIRSVAPKLAVSASCLSENVSWLADLPREIMLETNFSNTGKILNILQQRKIGLEHSFANSGHSCATARLKSYFAPAGVVREQLSNVGFYRFLCDLLDHFEERAEGLSHKLSEVAKQVFVDDRCTMSFAGTDEDYRRFWEAQPICNRTGAGINLLSIPEPAVLNEAFVVPTDVCFAATGWDRRRLELPHTGAWLVAGRALSYDYLWNEVRVKGGAYGTGFQAMRSGTMRFYSYRDPHLDETLQRIRKAPGWLSAFKPSNNDLEGFVVATVAGIDAPVKPRELVRRQMGDFFTGHSPEERIERRQEVIEVKTANLQALAPAIEQALQEHAVCVFGNREILESSKEKLSIIPLVG